METTQKIVFDAGRNIEVQLPRPNGNVTVTVSFPSDEQWLRRQRNRKILIKNIGRGASQTTVPDSEEADGELLSAIQIDFKGEGEIDIYEAAKVIDMIAYCEVDDAEKIGDTFEISQRVPGGVVKHVLRMPSAKDVALYRRSFAKILDLPFGRQQLTLNLTPAAELYDRLLDHTEGYAGAAPVIHKSVAVKTAVDLLDAQFQNNDDDF